MIKELVNAALSKFVSKRASNSIDAFIETIEEYPLVNADKCGVWAVFIKRENKLPNPAGTFAFMLRRINVAQPLLVEFEFKINLFSQVDINKEQFEEFAIDMIERAIEAVEPSNEK